MKPNIQTKVAARVMNKWGEDCQLSTVGGTTRAIVKKLTQDLDNKDIMMDGIYEITFLKPLPASPMRKLVLTDADGDSYVLGKSIGTNGYLVQYEATPE